MNPPSPIDVVLGHDPAYRVGRRGVRALAWVAAIAVHGVLVAAALRGGPSLESWSAAVALEVHEALVDDQVIELATPPTPEPVAEEPPTPRARAPVAPSSELTTHKAPTPTTPSPSAPPTAAAAVVTQDNAPVDLTGTTIVTGSATSSLGGAASATGTGTTPAKVPSDEPAEVALPAKRAAVSVARAVQLDPANWRCDWPREAISQEIYEQAVVLRVVVLADGRVEAAQLIDDPGHGFGPAALACARRTRFTPALDADGNPTRALSPPIRVRFTR